MLISFLLKILQGAFIGLGAVLPGISGGVLSVCFGVYQPLMEFLADPLHKFKSHLPTLAPYFLGYGIGFLGIARILGTLFSCYPVESICLFSGIVFGMMPELFEEAGMQGRNKTSYLFMILSAGIMVLFLTVLRVFSITLIADWRWYVFCGFALALSILAPGMSFSTLLMPLGLYTPFIDGIGRLSPQILIPSMTGGLLTIFFLSRGIHALLTHFYSYAFHGIVGIVFGATIMSLPSGNKLIILFFLMAGLSLARVCNYVNTLYTRL